MLGRGGGGGGRRSSWVRPLEVCHVAVGKVGHEGAVRETASKEVHDCARKVGVSGGWLVALQVCLLISWLNGVKAETGRDGYRERERDTHTDQRLDE